MEQARIIEKTTELFIQKLKDLNNKNEKIEVGLDDVNEKELKSSFIKLTLLGVVQNKIHNSFEKIQRKEVDNDGTQIEYFVPPPTIVDLKYMITPYCSKKQDVYKLLGMIIRHLKDNNSIESKEIDWVENNERPINIVEVNDMDLNKQIGIFNLLNMKYNPSLFFNLKVGINSDKKEGFKRVEKRKFDVYDKQAKNK